MFQSSPVLWDGRYPLDRGEYCSDLGFNPRPSCGTGATTQDNGLAEQSTFQSSPVLWDGRYSMAQRIAKVHLVSILARPVGRALQ